MSLPYSDNRQRKQALVSRVSNLYPLLDADKVVYKVMHGFYIDDKLIEVFDPNGRLT
ncbi:MAG: hypothetical protein WA667_24770 [Candidatus Nitrosopolaris sp.]